MLGVPCHIRYYLKISFGRIKSFEEICQLQQDIVRSTLQQSRVVQHSIESASH